MEIAAFPGVPHQSMSGLEREGARDSGARRGHTTDATRRPADPRRPPSEAVAPSKLDINGQRRCWRRGGAESAPGREGGGRDRGVRSQRLAGGGHVRAVSGRPLVGVGLMAGVPRRLPPGGSVRGCTRRRPTCDRPTSARSYCVADRRVPATDHCIPAADHRRRRGHTAARRGRPHRGQHGGIPRCAHRHQCAGRAGQAPRGQPDHHQQPVASYHRRQGQLHPPHRLRRGQGARRRPVDERRIRGRCRRQGHPRGPPPPARRARTGRGRREGERADPPRAVHRRCRHPGLPELRRGLRGPDPQDPHQQDRPRRLCRDHRDAHQSGHHRHGAVRAPADARPRGHRGRGRPRRAVGIRGRRPPYAGRARRGQDGDHHLDLRPPDHPGGRVGTVPGPGVRVPDGWPRILRGGVRVARHPLRAGHLAAGRQLGRRGLRRRPRTARQAEPRADPGQHVPGPRAPARPPRPAGRRARRPAPRARPAPLRPHHLGPAPALRGRRPGRQTAGHARRDPLGAARRLLPDARHRVHAHPGPRPEALDPAARGGCAGHRRPRRAASHPRPPQCGRGLRALPPHPLRGSEALRPRGGRVGHRHPRRHLERGGHRRPPRVGHGHVPPWPVERPGQHRREVLRRDLRGVRGQPRPRLGPGLGRREVPQGCPRTIRRTVGRHHPADHGVQPLPPRGGRPGRRGHGPGPTGRAGGRAGERPPARGRAGGPVPGPADPAPRRRGLRRAGRGGRDAEPVRSGRLPHGRNDPRGHQQPAGVHHGTRGGTQLGVPDRRRQDGPGPDLPRQRRRPRGVCPGGTAGLRLPSGVPQGRGHRHGLLSPLRPQ